MMVAIKQKHPMLQQVAKRIVAGGAIALLGVVGCTAQSGFSPEGQTGEPITIADDNNEDFQTVTVVDSLAHPWGLAWLPNGDLLITERSGQLRIVREGVLDPAPISGVPEIFAQGQGGLLDIAVHQIGRASCRERV